MGKGNHVTTDSSQRDSSGFGCKPITISPITSGILGQSSLSVRTLLSGEFIFSICIKDIPGAWGLSGWEGEKSKQFEVS